MSDVQQLFQALIFMFKNMYVAFASKLSNEVVHYFTYVGVTLSEDH